MKELGMIEYSWPRGDTHFKDFLTYQQRNRQNFIDAMTDIQTVIDIGAHAGSWTINFAGVAKRVYSYEPIHSKTLEQNVAQSGYKNITVRPYLLSKDTGEKTVWIRTDNSGDNGVDLNADFGRKPRLMNSTTLDLQEHVGKISGIKIDVQGHEYAVLLGAEYTITQHKPVLCCELVKGNESAELLLKTWGYELRVKSGKDWIWRHKDAI